MLASIIYDMTKLTPGHITSIFVIIGAFLSVFGVYDALIENLGYGLSLPIISFGNSLANAAYEGFKTSGFYGLFSNIYMTTSTGISGAIICGFIIALLCKPKD